ncbi:Protein GET4 [Linum perenne]
MSRQRLRRAALPPVQENVDKLQNVIKDGNGYGAQQMYKSISARYASVERFSEAVDLLYSGACLQLQHNQVTCGSELAVMFVDTLVKGKVPYDENTLDRVRTIYKLFPQIPVPQHLGEEDDVYQLAETLAAAKTRVECCSSFLKAAIKWSAEFGPHSSGSPELYVMLAEYLYSESPELDIAKITHYSVRGDDPQKFATILVSFMGKCYPGEDDLAIARAVLMYLSMGNTRDANFLLGEVKEQAEAKKLEFPQSDLITFITYLLQTLQRDAYPLFSMLRASYKPSIDREPVFNEWLDDIGEVFYGVQRSNSFQGMFGDMLKSIPGVLLAVTG